MNWITLSLEFLYSTLATGFFALIFRAPPKTIPASAIAGGLGWVLWRLLGSGLPAYFVTTFALAVFGEILARVMRKPATLFTHVAVIPLVPGMGLYRTMLFLVEGNTQQGLAVGAEALLAIGMMAMAIGLATLVFRRVVHKRPAKTGG